MDNHHISDNNTIIMIDYVKNSYKIDYYDFLIFYFFWAVVSFGWVKLYFYFINHILRIKTNL